MSLDSLVKAALGNELKFIFVGGKGGVGKTTSSSAIATLLSQTCQKRVLLISTDPAHSLSDAWDTTFSNEPISPLPNLDVMEVDPKDTMNAELEQWVSLSSELMGSSSSSSSSSEDSSSLSQQIESFRDWLSGIPGIDEATALSSAIGHIESGKYDLIVFDTAPTGHTLKLLGLPSILEKGIDKLQSWQGKLWGYWDMVKGFASSSSSSSRHQLREELSTRLTEYKKSIQKVACMLTDDVRTRFITICIAEYLSISETRRLINELKKQNVRASHVLVNQLLLVGDESAALTDKELRTLEELAEVGTLGGGVGAGEGGGGDVVNAALLTKTVHACRLTTARRNIQNKYLKVLKDCEEVRGGLIEGIVEVPLLPNEVRGVEAIESFSRLLVQDQVMMGESGGGTTTTKARVAPGALYDEELARMNSNQHNDGSSVGDESSSHSFSDGDIVRVVNLAKAAHFNGLKGTIISEKNNESGRYGVSIEYKGKKKSLALLPKNITIIDRSVRVKKQKCVGNGLNEKKTTTASSPGGGGGGSDSPITNGLMDKAKAVLNDPEIKAMVDSNPKVKDAIEDCLQNPMNFMKYISDPELSPFLSKAMSKLR